MSIIHLVLAAALSLPAASGPRISAPFTLAAGGCKAARSCADAVQMWCDGYRRADGDNDGIPCENVCSSIDEVEAIKAEIGC